MSVEKETINIDIHEDYLFKKDNLLDILLQVKTTQHNLIWATDSYEQKGEKYLCTAVITADLITGKKDDIIQPRVVKSKEEQLMRTRRKLQFFEKGIKSSI